MKRRYRLRRNADFQAVRRNGRAWPHQLLVLVALPNQLDFSRFGFVVSKRLGKAVQRNLIKRRMREVVRVKREQIAKGWDLVFIARKPIRNAEYRDVERAIETVLQGSGLGEVPEIEGEVS